MEQVIYSRYEYPVEDGIDTDRFFKECKDLYPCDLREDGLQIGGIGTAVRCTPGDKAVILLTYDQASDVFLKLKLMGRPGLKYNNLRK